MGGFVRRYTGECRERSLDLYYGRAGDDYPKGRPLFIYVLGCVVWRMKQCVLYAMMLNVQSEAPLRAFELFDRVFYHKSVTCKLTTSAGNGISSVSNYLVHSPCSPPKYSQLPFFWLLSVQHGQPSHLPQETRLIYTLKGFDFTPSAYHGNPKNELGWWRKMIPLGHRMKGPSRCRLLRLWGIKTGRQAGPNPVVAEEAFAFALLRSGVASLGQDSNFLAPLGHRLGLGHILAALLADRSHIEQKWASVCSSLEWRRLLQTLCIFVLQDCIRVVRAALVSSLHLVLGA
eukprot:285627-Amphidinium_carterae.2